MMNRPASKYALIQDVIMDPENVLTVTELCAMNGVSRSGYYSWCAQAESRAQREAPGQSRFRTDSAGFPESARPCRCQTDPDDPSPSKPQYQVQHKKDPEAHEKVQSGMSDT